MFLCFLITFFTEDNVDETGVSKQDRLGRQRYLVTALVTELQSQLAEPEINEIEISIPSKLAKLQKNGHTLSVCFQKTNNGTVFSSRCYEMFVVDNVFLYR